MADKPANQAPEVTDTITHLYGRAGASTGDGFVKFPETLIAHSVGSTVSNKGEIPFKDAAGLIDWLAFSGNGALLFGDSGIPEWLPIGTSNQILRVSAGGLPEWASVNPTGIVRISTQTVSSPVSSIVFTDIPSSGYTKFQLAGVGLKTGESAASSTVLVEVSTDNGSTFKTSSGDYYTSTSAVTNLATFLVPGTTSTFQHSGFSLEIFGLGNSSRATSCAALWSYTGASVTSVTPTVLASALVKTRVAAEADNAIRVRVAGQNFTAGTISLYGFGEP